jgi:hypothetical protein
MLSKRSCAAVGTSGSNSYQDHGGCSADVQEREQRQVQVLEDQGHRACCTLAPAAATADSMQCKRSLAPPPEQLWAALQQTSNRGIRAASAQAVAVPEQQDAFVVPSLTC